MKLIKMIVLFLLLAFLIQPVFSQQTETMSKPIEIGITFDWITKTQLQRDENIKEIQDILLNDKAVMAYKKKQFKQKYIDFWKDKNFLKNYEEIAAGKKEDKDKYYSAFYWDKLFVAYGIKYKNNMKNIYYYDVMGNLRWIDVFSSNYPNFPYWAYQYYRNGKLVAAYYYVTDYDQYVFDENKKFQGRWYKEKMYNRNAKVVMTRSNY